MLLELARTRNKAPLPKSIGGMGIPLPPEQDTLINPNYQLAIPRRHETEEMEEDEEAADGNPNPNPNDTAQDRRNLSQGAQRVSFPLVAKQSR